MFHIPEPAHTRLSSINEIGFTTKRIEKSLLHLIILNYRYQSIII